MYSADHKQKTGNPPAQSSRSTSDALTQERATKSNAIEVPSISLPKGGGAIKGIDEKFQVNPSNGTASFSVPLPLSPNRNGFTPSLSISYNSGAGNSVLGIGWGLDFPAIQRKTDKRLPRYRDFSDDEDTFMFSGAEDLVPMLEPNGTDWTAVETMAGGYFIQRFRPRIEGAFSKIERIKAPNDGVYWRVTDRNNITTIFGRSAACRVADPENPAHIFQWLPEFSFDDKGSVVLFEYKNEDFENLPDTLYNRNRRNADGTPRFINKYLKRIRYGNTAALYPYEGAPSLYDPLKPAATPANWHFELVLDYGEHDAAAPVSEEIPDKRWETRPDPFSDYRAGFEIRTCRLLRRVLMFHRFPELNNGAATLVRSLDFQYFTSDGAKTERETELEFLEKITQTGYIKTATGYSSKSLPPMTFEYQPLVWNHAVKNVGTDDLVHAPTGLSGPYQWVDLYNEGIPGILSEQGEAWHYKHNLGEVAETGVASFAPAKLVAPKPSFTGLGQGVLQLQDLDADGGKQIVVNTPGIQGYFDLAGDAASDLPGFENLEGLREAPFRPFSQNLNLDLRDPNVRLLDLNGDGKPEVVLTEENAFRWWPGAGRSGYEASERTFKPYDEEHGPAIVFSDPEQRIFLADMSGDGLTDIVRIRNGEVCYWPNLGYGHFGAKVTMDNSPWFDAPDQFNPVYLQLADISGTGATDLIYLDKNQFKAYLNLSGNAWGKAEEIEPFFPTEQPNRVAVTDLLGNGTACIVWSSELPAYREAPMRYMDLMGGKKPHIMTRHHNGMGKTTAVEYKSSTYFYLKDKLAGTPWVTRLAFPVQVVQKITVRDKWRNTAFSSTYSYHHGYYDHAEREFRGFGRVEQIDVEDFGTFAAGNVDSPYITEDKTLYQPPVKTITWYHTGAFLDRERILSQFQSEYFTPTSANFKEHRLPEPDIAGGDLSAHELREALRACKGMALRQEVYELDVDALEQGKEHRVKLFSTAFHNCHIRLLQPQKKNRHAVFLVTESEAITHHYELDLRAPPPVVPDPRIAHTLNLSIDEYGNVLESVAVAYPRIGHHTEDALLPGGADALIIAVQQETHLVYTQNRFTRAVPALADAPHHRLPFPCEAKTYGVTGPFKGTGFYFTLAELRKASLEAVTAIEYHALPNVSNIQRNSTNATNLQKRCVEHMRMLYFAEDLQNPLPWGVHNHLGLPYETYKLALTDDLLNAVLGSKLTSDNRNNILNQPHISGYFSGIGLAARFPGANTNGQYWIRSGIAGFEADAGGHFFLPERFTDPFGHVTALKYDSHDMYIQASTDALGNTTEVTQFDFRVLAPREIKDANNNLSELRFDALGMPVAMAVKGKGTEGDNLSAFSDALVNPDPAELCAFFTDWHYDEARAKEWLNGATVRYLYYFGEVNEGETLRRGVHPACACGLLRERHGDQNSPIQVAFEYSDGGGNVLMKKTMAEPAIANGISGEPAKKTIDDFSTGALPVSHYIAKPNDALYDIFQEGQMMGERRDLHLLLRGQSGGGMIEITPAEGFRFTSDSSVVHRFDWHYGRPSNPEKWTLLDLSAYNALRFRFSAVPRGLNFNVLIYFRKQLDNYALASLNIAPHETSHEVIFGFDQIAAAIADPDRPADFSQVSHIYIVTQSGGYYAGGGEGFSIKSIEAVALPRWITSGKTILNNKGKAVKQYEPYFTNAHRFEEPKEVGVTPVMYYDAAGRLTRTEMPDGSLSRMEFSPWQVKSFDANDTVLESGWYRQKGRNRFDRTQPLPAGANPDERAGWLAAQHGDTPAETILDSLGREVMAIAHNRTKGTNEKYVTFTKLDAEGKPLWIRDARGNLVMQYVFPYSVDNRTAPQQYAPCYDIAGNLLFQHSMDAGNRWMLTDAMAKPMLAWDDYKPEDTPTVTVERRRYRTEHDALHRPLIQKLQMEGGAEQIIERFVYGEVLADAKARNLRGQVYQHFDADGLMTNQRFDFKGNLLEATRQLTQTYHAPIVNWAIETPSNEIFTQRTEYDALNRMVRHENWHRAGSTPAIYTPKYNERGALVSEKIAVRGKETQAIRKIEYNEKGQRTRIQYGGETKSDGTNTIITTTRYHYDPLTFRLMQLRTTRHEYEPNPAFPAFRSNLKDAQVLQQLLYTYDPVGNITEIEDQAYEPAFFNNQLLEPKSTYTYDALYRLIEATGRENAKNTHAPPGFGPVSDAEAVRFPLPGDPKALRNYTQQYEYDAVGNFIKMQHIADTGSWTRHYQTAPDSNRLLRTWLGSDTVNAVDYQYDANGNMLNFNKVGADRYTRWDYRDMIQTLDLGGGGTAYYQYDSQKQRSRKRIVRNNNEYWERIYLGGYELYRRYVNSVLQEETETHHLFVDDQRVLIVEDKIVENSSFIVHHSSLFRFQYSNHLGSATLELNDRGDIISYEEYHPYGTSAYEARNAAITAAAKRYRYTGMERDEESRLAYHTARYYLGWLGRWGSCDPIGMGDGVNVYAFCNFNPITYSDTNGMQGFACVVAAGTTTAPTALTASGTWSAAIGIASGTSTSTIAPVAGAATSTTTPLVGATTSTASVTTGATASSAPLLLGSGVLALVVSMLVMGAYGASEIGKAQQSDEWNKTVEYYAKLSTKRQENVKQESYQAPLPASPEEIASRDKLRQILSGKKDEVQLPSAQTPTPRLLPSQQESVPVTAPPVSDGPNEVLLPGEPNKSSVTEPYDPYLPPLLEFSPKHQSKEYREAKAWLKVLTLLDPKASKTDRRWLEQERITRGDNPQRWRNPKGKDAGHKDPNDNWSLRWENSDMNRSRGGKIGR